MDPHSSDNVDPSLLSDLADLHRQATKERSHFYTAGVIRRVIALIAIQNAELARLRAIVKQIEDHQ